MRRLSRSYLQLLLIYFRINHGNQLSFVFHQSSNAMFSTCTSAVVQYAFLVLHQEKQKQVEIGILNFKVLV
jgi:hypothetical protein